MKSLCVIAFLLLAAGCDFRAELDGYCQDTQSCEQSASGAFCVKQDSACLEGECCAGLTCGPAGSCVPAAQLGMQPTSVDFGRIPTAVGGPVVAQRVVITNTGTVASGAVRIELPPEATSFLALGVTDCEGRVLAPQEACTLELRFTATQLGKRQTALVLRHEGPFVPVSLPVVGTVGTALTVQASDVRGPGQASWSGGGPPYLVSEPAGISCPESIYRWSGWHCTAYFEPGTQISLRSGLKSRGGYGIETWSGPCEGSGTECALTLAADAQVAVRFTPWLEVAAVHAPGSFGEVEVTGPRYPGIMYPGDMTCSGSCYFEVVGQVTLTVGAVQGTFAGWEGDCAFAGSTRTCTLDVQRANRVVARFLP